eukprot:9770-Heterococcus_DN1.PRE.1
MSAAAAGTCMHEVCLALRCCYCRTGSTAVSARQEHAYSLCTHHCVLSLLQMLCKLYNCHVKNDAQRLATVLNGVSCCASAAAVDVRGYVVDLLTVLVAHLSVTAAAAAATD